MSSTSSTTPRESGSTPRPSRVSRNSGGPVRLFARSPRGWSHQHVSTAAVDARGVGFSRAQSVLRRGAQRRARPVQRVVRAAARQVPEPLRHLVLGLPAQGRRRTHQQHDAATLWSDMRERAGFFRRDAATLSSDMGRATQDLRRRGRAASSGSCRRCARRREHP
eukprot:769817-Rhodomonas_salina.1